jgi:hypothetical protein
LITLTSSGFTLYGVCVLLYLYRRCLVAWLSVMEGSRIAEDVEREHTAAVRLCSLAALAWSNLLGDQHTCCQSNVLVILD